MTIHDSAETSAADLLAAHIRNKHNTGCDDIANDHDALVRRHMAVHNAGRFMAGHPHSHDETS